MFGPLEPEREQRRRPITFAARNMSGRAGGPPVASLPASRKTPRPSVSTVGRGVFARTDLNETGRFLYFDRSEVKDRCTSTPKTYRYRYGFDIYPL